MPDHPSPGNAFTPDFLARLKERDDSTAAAEARYGGPWEPRRLDDGSYGLFRAWESERTAEPYAKFADVESAQLFASVLPAFGRKLYRLGKNAGPAGFLITVAGGGPVGAMSEYNADLVQAANVAADLVRRPPALAALLEAAGPTVLEAVGRALYESTAE